MLGSVLASLGELDDAVVEYRKTLQLLQKTLGAEHPLTLEVSQDLAALLEATAVEGHGGKDALDEAENLVRFVAGKRQADMAPKSQSLRSPLAIDVELQAACLLMLKNNDAEASFFNSRILNADPDRQNTKDNLQDQACSVEALGKHDQAVQLMRRVYNDAEGAHGGNHPESLGALCDLAGYLALLKSDEDEEEAEDLFTQGIEHFFLSTHVRFGDDEEEVDIDGMQALDGLSRILENKECFAEAEVLLRRRLGECYRLFGSDHPETYETMHRLAVVLSNPENAQGDVAEAKKFLERELEGVEAICGTAYQDDSLCINKQLDNIRRRTGVA